MSIDVVLVALLLTMNKLFILPNIVGVILKKFFNLLVFFRSGRWTIMGSSRILHYMYCNDVRQIRWVKS